MCHVSRFSENCKTWELCCTLYNNVENCTTIYKKRGDMTLMLCKLHSAESTKLRVAEIFRCFLGLNKLSFILHAHLVPNLEIILQNVSSSYKILIKFLDSWSAHDLIVTIFKVLLLLRRAEAGIQAFRDERQDHKLSLRRLWPAEKFTFEYWLCLWVLINF